MSRFAYHLILDHYNRRRRDRNDGPVESCLWWSLYAFGWLLAFSADELTLFYFWLPSGRRRLFRWLRIEEPDWSKPRTDAGSGSDPIPSLKWPMIWICLAVYLTIASFADATVDRDSPSDAHAALIMFPLCAFGLWAACRFYARRLAGRKRWRQERLMQWILADNLPAPEQVDWVAFEREIEAQLTPQCQPSAPGGVTQGSERPPR